MQKQAVMQDVDVFDVGKEQLWQWCEWQHRLTPDGVMGLQCEADSLRKGVWLLVGNYSWYGQMQRKPIVWASFNSRKKALEAVAEYMEYDEKNRQTSPCGTGEDYEIWHVVDDDELWGEWEKAIETADALRMLREAGNERHGTMPRGRAELCLASRLYRDFQVENEHLRKAGVNVIDYVRLDQLEHKSETVEVHIWSTRTNELLSFTRLHCTDNARIMRYIDMATGNDVSRSGIAANITRVKYDIWGGQLSNALVWQHNHFYEPENLDASKVYDKDIPF